MRLETNGDPDERRYWSSFIADRFPNYERFWLKHVVPLTGRHKDPPHIGFLSREELGEERDEDVAVAQLHFTALLHVGRVYDLLHRVEEITVPILRSRVEPGLGSAAFAVDAHSAVGYGGGSASHLLPGSRVVAERRRVPLDFDTFTETFARLAGAHDVADELLQRSATPGTYHAWSEKEGETARRKWRDTHGYELRHIHDYRNRLVHGRVVPSFSRGGESWFPRVDRVNDHLDWRPVMSDAYSDVADDFEHAHKIVGRAWDEVVAYLESRWNEHLLTEG